VTQIESPAGANSAGISNAHTGRSPVSRAPTSTTPRHALGASLEAVEGALIKRGLRGEGVWAGDGSAVSAMRHGGLSDQCHQCATAAGCPCGRPEAGPVLISPGQAGLFSTTVSLRNGTPDGTQSNKCVHSRRHSAFSKLSPDRPHRTGRTERAPSASAGLLGCVSACVAAGLDLESVKKKKTKSGFSRLFPG
jgi:hypothetical protein